MKSVLCAGPETHNLIKLYVHKTLFMSQRLKLYFFLNLEKQKAWTIINDKVITI